MASLHSSLRFTDVDLKTELHRPTITLELFNTLEVAHRHPGYLELSTILAHSVEMNIQGQIWRSANTLLSINFTTALLQLQQETCASPDHQNDYEYLRRQNYPLLSQYFTHRDLNATWSHFSTTRHYQPATSSRSKRHTLAYPSPVVDDDYHTTSLVCHNHYCL